MQVLHVRWSQPGLSATALTVLKQLIWSSHSQCSHFESVGCSLFAVLHFDADEADNSDRKWLTGKPEYTMSG